MSVGAKICGLKTKDALNAAVEGGAAYVGFVFFRQSPRHLEIEAATALRETVPKTVKAVAVLVEPEQTFLEQLVESLRPDILQLHGRETPETVAELRKRYNIPVMKALPVAGAADLAPVARYAAVADMLLFDAKAEVSATRPGGNALSFDWSLLKGRTIEKPWMVSGGLNAGNVDEAVRRSGARLVDISSGVERAPGEKDPQLIREFLDLVKRL
jgi:phosphoribosylanthranilate isomerase